MRRPTNTAIVPMIHTAMNTQRRMWSITIATNFHSSQACKNSNTHRERDRYIERERERERVKNLFSLTNKYL